MSSWWLWSACPAKRTRKMYYKGRWNFILCGILRKCVSEGIANLKLDGEFQGTLALNIPLGDAMQVVSSEVQSQYVSNVPSYEPMHPDQFLILDETSWWHGEW
jgi:hypothetical protein